MALILTLRQGHDFFIERQRVLLSKVRSSMDFDLKTPFGHIHKVTEHGWIQILPGVKVQAAIPQDQDGRLVRVAIDAPGKNIVRGNLYRKNGGVIRSHCESCNNQGYLEIKAICPHCKGHGCSACSGGFIDEKFTCPECGGTK